MSMRYKGGVISATPPTVTTTSAPGLWTLEQQMQYQAAGVWPPSILPDPYFEYVTMLLHGDGTNGAQNNTFLDSSTNNFPITRNGDTTQGAFSPFSRADGNWSNYFNNSGRLALGNNSALLPGSGQFTVETWFNAGAFGTGFGGPSNFASNGNNCIFSYGAYGSFLRLILTGATPNLYLTNGQDALLNVDVSATVKIGGWNHVAVVRNSSNNIIVYLNGVAIGSPVANTTDFTGNLSIGADAEQLFFYQGIYQAATMNWTGYISNFRVVKGTAVYTENFTPSTSPLTAIANTGALTCQSNRFKDNSANNFVVTVSGTPSVQVFNPFNPTTAYLAATNGGSGYFDGTGDYLTYSTPSSTVRDWWVGDFTCEAWIYPTTLTGWHYNPGAIVSTLMGNSDPASQINYWSFGPINDGTVRLYYYNGAAVYTTTSTEAVKLNQWNHIAFTKSSDGIRYFVNGVGSASPIAVSGTPQSASGTPITIGQINATSINGYVSGLRIVYGTAVYSGTTYTVPTSPPTAITNTSLLLNFTNGGIFDNAAMNDLQTVGNAQISTSVVKFGTGSMAFDGSGDYARAAARPTFEVGSGDYTIEFWVYWNTIGNIAWFWGWGGGGTGKTFAYTYSDGRIALGINGTNEIVSSSGQATTGSWIHLAFVKNGSTTTIYKNGTSIASNTTSVWQSGTATDVFDVGGNTNCYIDDFRITKGYARYTANFTPPTAAFPNL